MKLIKGRSIYSVSEVNSYARETLEKMTFWVEGEVSSFKEANLHYRYVYFDLKDPQTGYKLPCILEPEIYQNLQFELGDGQKVLAQGSLTLWEKEAKFQLYIHRIEEFGEGILAAELEKLKKKLEIKGYFDPNHKIPLPAYPTNIAVITSKVANAWFDFKKHSIDMFEIIKLTFFDVMVQGPASSQQIVKSVKKADKMGFDAIVLVRGGGSLEDLASFNDEQVADAIYLAKTCIVVGVGHEKDVTIAQLVADIAASTPTDAAKIITADFVSLQEKLAQIQYQMTRSMTNIISSNFQHLDILFNKLQRTHDKYLTFRRHLNFLKTSLSIAQNLLIRENVQKVQNLYDKLLILSPEKTLQRGYSITYDQEGQIIKDAARIAIGANLLVKLAKGNLSSKVFAKILKS